MQSGTSRRPARSRIPGGALLPALVTALILSLAAIPGCPSEAASQTTVTSQVTGSTNDANEDGTTFDSSSAALWLGAGASSSASYTGLRFTNLAVPQGAVVSSAHLEVYSTQSQWLSLGFSIRAEATGNSPAFSSASRPSQRLTTTQVVNHSSNTSWQANTWYSLDEIGPVIQAVVSRPDWQQGNSLSLVLKGTGSAWARKFIRSVDGTAGSAAKLVIVLASDSGQPTVTPTATAQSATWTPSVTPTPRPPTSTPTFTPINTLTPTVTATFPSVNTPTPTTAPSATPTVVNTPTPATSTFFPIGPGYSDVIPHQIIRADNDRLYVFASQADSPRTIRAYRSNNPGLPSSSSDFTNSSLSIDSDIISLTSAYNGGNFIHVLVNTQSGSIRDYPFDLTSNSFRTAKTLASDAATFSGIGTSGLSAMFDKANTLQIVYWATSNHIIHHAYSLSDDSLTLTSGPNQLDPGGRIARHPVLAVSPLDNSLVVAWISPNTSDDLIAGNVMARTRSSSGSWGSVTQVNSAPAWTSKYSGIDIDQGPSLIVTSDGVVHLAYIENYDGSGDYGRVHYVTGSGTTWTDTALSAYSHDPALATDSANNIFIIGHGHLRNATCTSDQDLCVKAKQPDGTWGPSQLFATHPVSGSFDASTSVKWSAVGWNRPDAVEFVFFSAENGSYSNTVVYYGRLSDDPSPTPSPLPTSTPTITAVPTSTATAEPTATDTAVPTETLTPVLVASPTATEINVPTDTPEPTPTPSPVPTATETSLPTDTPEPTSTPSPLPTPTEVGEPEGIPEPTSTPTEISTPISTPESTSTASPLPTATEVSTPTLTPEPTLMPTETSVPTDTPVPTPALTETSTPTDTPEPTATPSPLPTATETSTPTSTPEPTPTATSTSSPLPSPTPSATPGPTKGYIQSSLANSTGSIASQSVTLPSPVTAGDLLVVAVSAHSSGTADVSSVTDSLGSIYVRAAQSPAAPAGSHHISVWYASGVAGGHQVTVTARAPAGNNEYLTVAAHEYRGLAPSGPLDQARGNSGTGLTATSGLTNLTGSSSELVFGAHLHKSSGSITASAGSGFAIRQSMIRGRYEPLVTEDRFVTAIGQYEATLRWASSTTWNSVVVTFR